MEPPSRLMPNFPCEQIYSPSTILTDAIISLSLPLSLHFRPASYVFLLPQSLDEVNSSPCGRLGSQQTCIQITHICSVVRVVGRPSRPRVHIMKVFLLKPFVKVFTPGKRQLHRTLNERAWPCDVSS